MRKKHLALPSPGQEKPDLGKIARKFNSIYIEKDKHPGPDYVFYSNTNAAYVKATLEYLENKAIIIDVAYNSKGEVLPDHKAIFVLK
jgi:hypothetical protein